MNPRRRRFQRQRRRARELVALFADIRYTFASAEHVAAMRPITWDSIREAKALIDALGPAPRAYLTLPPNMTADGGSWEIGLGVQVMHAIAWRNILMGRRPQSTGNAVDEAAKKSTT